MEDQRKQNRDYNTGVSTPGDENVRREVHNLIKNKMTDNQAWASLKKKYGNDERMVNDVLDAYKKRLEFIYKKARKLKELLERRYAGFEVNKTDMFKKAHKFQRKYKFSDDEFSMFMILVMSQNPSDYGIKSFSTNLARTLGYDPSIQSPSSQLNVKPEDVAHVEEIINRYGATRSLHSNVCLQTLAYADCAIEALTGSFNRDKHNAYASISPVLAAMFLPKINLFDNQILMSNIGNIIKTKYNKEHIFTQPDFELYWAMVMDPNDSACNIFNPILDIKNRFELQTYLWDSVLQLRQGRYYYEKQEVFDGFLRTIEKCRNVVHDAPDLTYIRDEGTIFRKILSAFSLYPTYVQTFSLNPTLVSGKFNVMPTGRYMAGFQQIIRVPMIILRLPPVDLVASKHPQPIDLMDSMNQPQWFIENKQIVPKTMVIRHSCGVICFYVGRRFQQVDITKCNAPFQFNNLPMTVSSVESLNKYPVGIQANISVSGDVYSIRSVVAIEELKIKVPCTSTFSNVSAATGKSVVIGSSALIRSLPSLCNGSDTCYSYDPQSAATSLRQLPNQPAYNKPVTRIPMYNDWVADDTNNISKTTSFYNTAKKRGTIFIYQKMEGAVSNPMFPG